MARQDVVDQIRALPEDRQRELIRVLREPENQELLRRLITHNYNSAHRGNAIEVHTRAFAIAAPIESVLKSVLGTIDLDERTRKIYSGPGPNFKRLLEQAERHLLAARLVDHPSSIFGPLDEIAVQLGVHEGVTPPDCRQMLADSLHVHRVAQALRKRQHGKSDLATELEGMSVPVAINLIETVLPGLETARRQGHEFGPDQHRMIDEGARSWRKPQGRAGRHSGHRG